MDLVPKPHGVTRWVCLKTVGAVLAPLNKLENDSILVRKLRAIVLLLMEERTPKANHLTCIKPFVKNGRFSISTGARRISGCHQLCHPGGDCF